MASKHKPEDIIGKLREAKIVLAQRWRDGCRCMSADGVTEQSYYSWRNDYGGLKMDQAQRMVKHLYGRAASNLDANSFTASINTAIRFP